MKILIANPPWEAEGAMGHRSGSRWPHLEAKQSPSFPIYMAYASAVAKQTAAEVVSVDAIAERMTREEFVKHVVQECPDRIVIETATPTINMDIETSRQTVNALPKAELFLCGAHATVFDEDLLRDNDFLSGIIRGEYEYTIRDLAKGLPLNAVAGLTCRDGKDVVRNNDRLPIEPLDDLPFPDWASFAPPRYERTILRSPSAILITSRGCPFQCTYCLWPEAMYGHKQRRRSAKNVCDEIEELIKKYDIRAFRFDDDVFALNREHVMGICEEMIRRDYHKKLIWDCFGHVSRYDKEMYELMARAGCCRVEFGIESGSTRILKSIKKQINLEQAEKVVGLCKSLNIQTYGTYMIGFPGETEEDILKTMDVALRLDTDLIQVSYVTPYPGTPMFDMLKERGVLGDDICWSDFASGKLPTRAAVSSERLAELNRLFWRKYFLRPRYAFIFFKRFFEFPHGPKKATDALISFIRRILPTERKWQ